jgi:hypothetical protein
METRIEKVECWVLRAPIGEPVANAFGAMTNRPAVFLRVSASDGAWGWGEVFSNFPQVGAEHRARLVDSIFAPLLSDVAADDPAPVRALLERRTRQMAIQCGEPGPFAQITGAVDQALWDMAARRAGVPLWKHLGGHTRCACTRAGSDPTARTRSACEATRRLSRVQAEGRLRRRARRCEPCRDARCARRRGDDHGRRQPGVVAPRKRRAHRRARALWSALDRRADRRRSAARRRGARWPMPAPCRSPPARICAASRSSTRRSTPAISDSCSRMSASGAASAAGSRSPATPTRADVAYCPHWLAGGVGLAASMHALAGSGSVRGYAEVDANPNPLREEVFRWRSSTGA